MTPTDQILAQTLLGAGLLNQTQLKRMQVEQQKWGGKLHHYASELGMVREDQVAATLARELKVPLLRLAEIPVDQAALRLVSAQDCERLTVYPAALRDDGKTLWLAMSDPLDVEAVDHVRARAGVVRVVAAVAGRQEIRSYVHRSFTLLGRGKGKVDLSVDAPVSEEFKIVDTAGRTQVHHISELMRGRPDAPPAAWTHSAPPAHSASVFARLPPGHPGVPVMGAPVTGTPIIGAPAPYAPPAATPAWTPGGVVRPRPTFATVLLDAGVVDPATLGRASAIAVSGDVPVVFALTRWRLVDPALVAAALSRALACPIVGLDADAQIPALPVQRTACTRMRVLPLWLHGGVVGLAMSDPTDDVSVEALASVHNVAIERLLVNDDDLERLFQAWAARSEGESGVWSPAPQSASTTTPAGRARSNRAGPATAPPRHSRSAPGAAPAHNIQTASLDAMTTSSGQTRPLSIIEGVLAEASDEAPDDADDDFVGQTVPRPAALDLAGATLDPSLDDEPASTAPVAPVPHIDPTVADDVLSMQRVLVVAHAKNGDAIRAGLQARLRELVIVARFSDAVTMARERSFHHVVVVDPPDSVTRSAQFTALTEVARRDVLVVGGSSSMARQPRVRLVPRGVVDSDVVGIIVAHLRDALES